jgi:monoamine oxidase
VLRPSNILPQTCTCAVTWLPIQVTTGDGSAYTAPSVIVTVSLGVLKRGSISFTPGLPAAKSKSISAVGMGTLDEVVMVWGAPFWDTDMDWLLNVPAAGSTDVCAEWWVRQTARGCKDLQSGCWQPRQCANV